jgi:hypothetical protein
VSTLLKPDLQAQIEDEMRRCRYDPLRFVRLAYPWGESGPLERSEPDKWQCEGLEWLGQAVREREFNGSDPVAPIRMAFSSGHGVGKTAWVAWIVDWIMSCWPFSRGTVTATDWNQLTTVTWAAVMAWTQMCITSDWFDVNTSEMRSRDPKARAEWRCRLAGSKDENAVAFQGQHAPRGSSFYVFDEDSGIGPKIHEAAQGGLTDGMPIVIRLGNCTRSSGPFYEACFGADRDRYKVFVIDSRTVARTNKALLQEWVDTYGEDSDFVRVRVRGLPPRASDLQFIDQERVRQAQKREITILPDEPLVCGVDVSDGGAAWNVIRFRRGMDARSIPPVRIPGEAVRNDRGLLLARLTDVLTSDYDGERVHMMFIDSGMGGPYVERLKRMGHGNVQEVRFGGQSPDRHQKNMRAYMWARMKEWLLTGTLDDSDNRLETDLTAPGYHLNRQDRLVIESKEDMAKRGVASPDDGDALALTFAHNVTRRQESRPRIAYRPPGSWAAA